MPQVRLVRRRLSEQSSTQHFEEHYFHNAEVCTVRRLRRGERLLPSKPEHHRGLCLRCLGRPTGQGELWNNQSLQPLLMASNGRSKLEPTGSDKQRCVCDPDGRVLHREPTLSQLHLQPV